MNKIFDAKQHKEEKLFCEILSQVMRHKKSFMSMVQEIGSELKEFDFDKQAVANNISADIEEFLNFEVDDFINKHYIVKNKRVETGEFGGLFVQEYGALKTKYIEYDFRMGDAHGFKVKFIEFLVDRITFLIQSSDVMAILKEGGYFETIV